jgi:hypothetical protein
MSEPPRAALSPEIEARLRAQTDLTLPATRWPTVGAQLAELLAGLHEAERLLDLTGVEPGPLWRPDVEPPPSTQPPDAVGRPPRAAPEAAP